MSEVKVDSIGPRVDSGTLTIGAAGDTVNIAGTAGTGFPTPTTGIAASAITTGTMATARLGSGTASSSTFLRGDQTYAAAGGTNTPSFHIRKSSNQTGLSSGGWTKVTFDDEVFDTDNAFASDKFTAPSNGKYFFTATAKINATDGNNGLIGSGMRFYISGGIAATNIHFMNANPSYAESKTITAVLSLTANQYVEAYAYAQDDGGGSCSITGGNDRDTFFMGFKLI